MFKTDINVLADYNKVIERLKRKIDDKKFFKGYFDKRDSVVYYYSTILPNPLKTTYLPIIKIQIHDLKEKNKGVKINFKVIPQLLIMMGVVIIASWIGFAFMINDYGQRLSLGIVIPLTASIAFPLLLKNLFDKELLYFKSELKKITEETESVN